MVEGGGLENPQVVPDAPSLPLTSDDKHAQPELPGFEAQ